jgi:glycerol-3-phosphate O-acyltransferase
LQLEAAGKVHVSNFVRRQPPGNILDGVLATWAGYHSARQVVRVQSGSIIAEDPNLLLFYQNRLRPFAIAIAGDDEADQVAAREIAGMEQRA